MSQDLLWSWYYRTVYEEGYGRCPVEPHLLVLHAATNTYELRLHLFQCGYIYLVKACFAARATFSSVTKEIFLGSLPSRRYIVSHAHVDPSL